MSNTKSASSGTPCLKPKEVNNTVRPVCSKATASFTQERNLLALMWLVSMTWPKLPSVLSNSRSKAMLSASVVVSLLKGCLRRVSLKRLTKVSTLDSKNKTCVLTFCNFNCSMCAGKVSMAALRLSMLIATLSKLVRLTLPGRWFSVRKWSAICGSMVAGKLSMQ